MARVGERVLEDKRQGGVYSVESAFRKSIHDGVKVRLINRYYA